MAGTFTAWRVRRAPARRMPSAPARRMERAPARRTERDADFFLDVVIMLSVVMFMLLASGVGVLALQTALR